MPTTLNSTATPIKTVPAWHIVLLFLAALFLALAFQGKRGLWSPDEGRYSNVALQMVASGDYWVPRRNDDVLHVTKPPITYWAMATSVNVFGQSEWSLRLPMAFAFALTGVFVFGLGRQFVPERPWLPALIYISSPFPYVASSIITTDTVLACAETAALWAYSRYCFGKAPARWLDVMWALFGFAFMVKGPPALLPLLAILVWEIKQGRKFSIFRPIGLIAFLVIGLSWFLWIVLKQPDLLSYFLGHELFDRIATNRLNRNSEWFGGFRAYFPSLLLGALPWLAFAAWHRWRGAKRVPISASSKFLWYWFALPMIVFMLVRSRLPLYVLPLFVPISLLFAQGLSDIKPTRKHFAWVALWIFVLLSTKAYISGIPTDRDERKLATELRRVLPADARELVFVDTRARYGLRNYLGTEIESVSSADIKTPQPPSDAPFDGDLHEEMSEDETGRYYLVPSGNVPAFEKKITASGDTTVVLGGVRYLTVVKLVGKAEPGQ